MGETTSLRFILSLLLTGFLQSSYGCQMDGVTLGPVPVPYNILDTLRGSIVSTSTSNIEKSEARVHLSIDSDKSITNISFGEGMLAGPYLDITLINSQFVMQTNNAYEQYEENETSLSMSVTINFSCTGGSTNFVIFVVNIIDTNNNPPRFIPTDEYEFVVAPPLPPGFLVTGCLNDITARDIDLTTSSIIFSVEENPYFEIEYDAASSTVPKEFKAQLKTSTFIRTLRDPVTLRISATDVDATGDPPHTTYATVTILGDSEFEFPEEPMFSQTFYFATYTVDHILVLAETISLQHGFDEFVDFTLDGEYSSYFTLRADGNYVSLDVSTPLPEDVFAEGQIYLIVRADREYTSGDSATIVIHFPEVTPLQFESILYTGAIVDNILQLPPLVLSQGHDNAIVSAEIKGEYAMYFVANVEGNLVTLSMDPLPDEIIEDNNVISIPVAAFTDRSIANTIVNLEIMKDDNVTPIFDKSIYTGSYDPAIGLTMEQIVVTQGFDATVDVVLEGERANLFQMNRNGPTITIELVVAIPPELYEERRITLSIAALKPRTVGANAAIIIDLPAARELNFEEPTYRGTIQDNVLTLQTILLREGYDENVQFSHSGEYSNYFTVTNIQNQVTISLSDPLLDNIITQNNVIMLTLTASGLNAVSTTTSILLDIIKEDTTTPQFSQNIYYGTYNGPTNFEIENILLAQGFDNEVSFRLDGAHAQYFEVSNVESAATLSLRSAIPEDVIFNEKVLLFNILAEKALTVGSNAAVLIRFPPELTESTIMRFSQNSYVGALEEDTMTLENIVLDTGYADGTQFILSGDHAEHFDILNTNNIVHVSILNALPSAVMEDNDFIILSVEARRQRAVSAWTSIIVDIVKEDVTHPVFNQAYYRGSYSRETALQFEESVFLLEGYDETVAFELEGEQAALFSVTQNNNAVVLLLNSPIPESIIENNNQLLFTIVAHKNNEISGRAVISIDLPQGLEMRFSQDFYKGNLEDGILTLDVLSVPGFSIPSDVIFTLSGDYAQYFQLINQDGNLVLVLMNPIPDNILEEIDTLVFVVEIENGQNITKTIIIIEVNSKDEELLSFEEAYYVGAYTQEGLEFDELMRINTENFDDVVYALDGEDAQWFGLEPAENTVTLISTSTIPQSVLDNSRQLIFVISAQRPDSTQQARATIVITLSDVNTETSGLGFDQINYQGSIENNQATIPTITLSEGYVPGVVFTLHGDLASYFIVSPQGATVTVSLQTPIPEQSIPANGVIVMEIQASAPPAIPAYATLVFVLHGDGNVPSVVELVFAQAFYTGSYTDTDGLTFTTPISLTEGYDESVEFALEGDNAQWFALIQTENSLTLVLSSPIPAAVLANNQQLIFVIIAQRDGSTETRATIVISLTAEYTDGLILGFDQVTYQGSIENNQATIPTITLSEGYVPGVVFTLHGDLASYFIVSPQGATVTVTLQTPIPEQSIPANGVIVMEIQASAPPAIPAYATLVFVLHGDGNVPSVVELVFAQAFYTGSYTDTDGLTFTTPISLTEGYDESVEFALEGDNAQWFALIQTENSLTLVLSSPIPAAVLANNQQLIFVIIAQRDGSTETRATIVISLTAEYTDGLILGFDQVTYQGSIENNQATIPTITLSEGYVPGVVFTLHGDLASYFIVSPQGATVTVTLQTPIPEQSIPANGVIVMEIQASAPPAIPAYATLVFVLHGDGNVPSVVELVFAQAFYTGSYTDTDGLTFTTPISLTEGYDESVEFALEGDNAQWFALIQTENSLTLVLSSPIPAAVLANNQQLIFVIIAQRDGSTETRATIVISLTAEYTDGLILGFDQVTYQGSIENNQATIPTITLSEGYVPGVVFTLHGDLASYFIVSPQGATVTVTLQTPIPEQSIPANGVIVMEIQASAPPAIPAYATLVFVLHGDGNVPSVVELVFAQAFYTGSYTDTDGLTFTTPISLTEGYDESVEFALEGDNAQWFALIQTENSLTLVLSSPIPAAVLANNQQLIFVIIAQIDGSTETRATIVISLTAEYTNGLILGFDQVTYQGSIENNQATIPTITLSEGYVPGVVFTLHGDLASYFIVSPQGATVTVTLQTPIPEQSIPANGVIVIEIQASAPPAIPAYATLVFVLHGDGNVPSVVELVFAQAFYTGSYTDTDGLTFTTPISLTEGYDESVEFALEGDNAQWFALIQTENSLTLVLSSPIPAAVLANNQQLIFVIIAQRDGSTGTRATIVISLTAEYTDSLILGFDQVTYQGSIENNQATIPTITLSEGYVPGVVFTLHGDLASYFIVSPQGATVTVTLQTPIPEQSIPANGVIVMEIQASAPPAIPAYATLVFVLHGDGNVPSVVELVFAQAFYTGSYTDTDGLTFTTPISLTEGYDESVEFALEGDNAQWFALIQTENSLTLVLSSPIPAAVLANNQQLIFVIIAQRDGSTETRATIVISLTAEYTDGLILGFDQVTYQGSIENNQATIPTITLSEGYVPGVVFTLHGDLASYFIVSPQGATVTVTLQTPIPEQSIPANGVIVMEIQASAPPAIPAYATLVFVLHGDGNVPSVVELVFAQAFYTGSYTDTDGLTFTTPISLTEGYDESVEFALEGDNAQWFALIQTENSLTLVLSSPIPAAVLANNQQLIFVIIAQRDGSTEIRATIVISLTAEYTNGLILGFDQVTYQGSIENNQATIPTITLSEGYVPGVVFTLHGDLASYFIVSPQGATVTVTLQTPIPEQSIPANGVIVIEIQASAPPAIPAYATLVFVLHGDGNVPSVVELVFAQAFYTGSYTDTDGLTFTTPISLTEGYDESVEFALEGDNAQWFALIQTENSLTLVLSSPIPAAVLANNQQLIFVIIAQRDGSTGTRATIVISLTAEYTDSLILGFDQVTYQGSIENNQATIPTITLSEGYVPGVVFTLHGDLASYFIVSPQGATVTVTLQTPIPEQSIPANGVIVMEIQASAPPAIPAYATLVFVLHGDGNVPSVVELVFAQAFYTGSYTDTDGLTFTTPISLTEGYDESVEFALEGDNAQWFALIQTENSLTLVLSSPIPAAVLANNQQLIFVIIAQRDGSTETRATIVISLTAEYTDGMILGFDQVTYQGSIENNQATIPTITLSEGYVPGVVFTLHGDLASYFIVSPQGATVTVTLQTPIPEQSIPANGVIVMEIQASAPPAIPAYATLVFVLHGDGNVPSVVELVFAQAFYTGSYTDTDGLTFTTPISLTEGYDESVEFALEGDNAQWFALIQTENSLTLVLSSPIPAAVLANNQQLIFVIIAQRDGSTETRATIVISLTAEYTDGMILGFDQVTYQGSIENNQATIPTITLSEGYVPGVVFTLHGDLASYFIVSPQGATVTVTLQTPIPEQSIPANGVIVMEIQASAPPAIPAVATLVIYVVPDSQLGPDVWFEKVIFEGVIQNDVVNHETITINGYTGTSIELSGVYASLFVAELSNDRVTIRIAGSVNLPVDITHLSLELRAGTARAVLILSFSHSDIPSVPVVTFSSASYAVRVEITNTGRVGQVQASADNGEAVLYSLQLDSLHLQERLSVNEAGELHLAAPVNSGLYTFQVLATTIFTQATASATVYLSSEAITVCGDELVMPPLIVLDRDEEEPHYNLMSMTHDGCHFSLANRWPLDQSWLYVDETGLHATAIDREHESIAFMALSQVQVEVTLHCDTDVTRSKRSLNYSLGPYDYGTSKWVLTDTILYNSRRSFVNLIVNDINDNAPVFVGKEHEPIAVGYPVAALEQRVLPRSLAELQATDADIGENAALMYWSSEPVLAVAPTTGFVHIRDGASLENDARLTVHATDQNGQGLTGSIDIIVKLLDERNIAVVTVKNAFLDEENNVLSLLSESVGYDVKVLRAVVISDDEEGATKLRRSVTAAGATLQLYVYGLIEREPVSVEQLTADITDIVITQVNIASTISLEDHLAGQEICVIPGRDTGLLAATIVLSVLLFIIIVLIAVWFFLRWRKNRNYDQFSDENSLASQNESVDQLPKPVDVLTKPRLNIEELKKSERRLQEMLDAPIQDISVEPKTSRNDAIIDIPTGSELNAPIVFQSIDKLKDAADESSDDEFGERASPKRKSVVTFNENVEKIIHVEDDLPEDLSTTPGYEIYKL